VEVDSLQTILDFLEEVGEQEILRQLHLHRGIMVEVGRTEVHPILVVEEAAELMVREVVNTPRLDLLVLVDLEEQLQ
jgi:hypothetical protein